MADVVLEMNSTDEKSKELRGMLLEAKVFKQKLPYFGHMARRKDWVGKDLMLGRTEKTRRGEDSACDVCNKLLVARGTIVQDDLGIRSLGLIRNMMGIDGDGPFVT